jgi:hypothetical protein
MEQRGHADEAPGIVRHTRHVCVSSSPGCNETPSGVKVGCHDVSMARHDGRRRSDAASFAN